MKKKKIGKARQSKNHITGFSESVQIGPLTWFLSGKIQF